jgi:Zn-dependent metalloprotease
MVCHIAPPDLLARLIEHGTPEQRRAATLALASSATHRAQRRLVGRLLRELDVDVRGLGLLADAPGGTRSVYDVEHGGFEDLPGKLVRGPDDGPVADEAVNEAFDGAGTTHAFYLEVYERDSVDGKGAGLVSSVHYGVDYDNALWNGSQMVYGDGSGQIFQVGALTRALDVIGHELTHGVTQYTANLTYSKQPGALNEHFSDVFGSLVKQYAAGQNAAQADWLIGAGTLVPSLGRALRSMEAPGTAYEGDNQPSNMRDYVDLPDDNDPANDNGGVHINSGIPNHAFYLAATAIGGNAWEKAGRVWYVTLTERTAAEAQFADVATATVDVAGELFSSSEQGAIESAWKEVGVIS